MPAELSCVTRLEAVSQVYNQVHAVQNKDKKLQSYGETL